MAKQKMPNRAYGELKGSPVRDSNGSKIIKGADLRSKGMKKK